MLLGVTYLRYLLKQLGASLFHRLLTYLRCLITLRFSGILARTPFLCMPFIRSLSMPLFHTASLEHMPRRGCKYAGHYARHMRYIHSTIIFPAFRYSRLSRFGHKNTINRSTVSRLYSFRQFHSLSGDSSPISRLFTRRKKRI